MISTAQSEHKASLTGRQVNNWRALCYHDVQPEMPRAGGGPAHFTVPLESFERMLDTMLDHGFTGCSVENALAAPGTARLAITFDDGTLGQYEYALPALLARGMTATFYVTTSWVGTPGFMTWAQLREMVACGMSIQSHTVTHPFLSELDADALRKELAESKREIDRQLGQETKEIAFPGGDAPAARYRQVIKEAGYAIAVGTRWGRNPDAQVWQPARTFVRRCTVKGVLSEDMAQRMVRGDAWLTFRWTAKEATLRRLRSTLGASRYARWRRTLLDAIS